MRDVRLVALDALGEGEVGMIVAGLALTVALSGAGYPALILPKNSVGTAQLQRSAVTAKRIRRREELIA